MPKSRWPFSSLAHQAGERKWSRPSHPQIGPARKKLLEVGSGGRVTWGPIILIQHGLMYLLMIFYTGITETPLGQYRHLPSPIPGKKRNRHRMLRKEKWQKERTHWIPSIHTNNAMISATILSCSKSPILMTENDGCSNGPGPPAPTMTCRPSVRGEAPAATCGQQRRQFPGWGWQ